MKASIVLHFDQTDSLSGGATYRMHIAEASADRIVYDENASTMRYLLITLFHPSEMQSIYYLERESQDISRYHGVMCTAKRADGLAAGNESSSINRAVPFYRLLAGISTDHESPAAR